MTRYRRRAVRVLAAFALASVVMTAPAACSGGTSNAPEGGDPQTASATPSAAPPETANETAKTPDAEQTAARDGAANPEPEPVEAGRVSFAAGGASFVPPEGFRRLTPGQIAAKFPGGSPPQDVFANRSQSVSVAITLSPARLGPSQLGEYKQYLEQALPDLTPGLRWRARDFEDIGGRRWIHLEFVSSAVDTDVHNEMYITSSGGMPLQLNFNSTTGQYPEYEERLEKSKNSLSLSG